MTLPTTLSPLLYIEISHAVSHGGTYNPNEIMCFLEEKLTSDEHEICFQFLSWCHNNKKSFGHGNYQQVYQQFYEDYVGMSPGNILESVIAAEYSGPAVKEYFSEKRAIAEFDTGIPVIQVHAVMLMWFANNSMRKDNIIDLAFPEMPGQDKNSINAMLENSEYNFFEFLTQLNEKQRGQFIRYVLKNYSIINQDDIARLYF